MTQSIKIIKNTIICFFMGASAFAQHTFSIVAVDPETGEIGSAGATCLDIDDLNGEEGAYVVSDIVLGIGAINTQSAWDPINQMAARDRMEAGDSPQMIIDWLFANDPAPGTNQTRQYGIVDLIDGVPRSAAFTGTSNGSVANDIVGPNYAIQGNILISQDVLDDMETAFLNTTGTLADKLIAAMQGAKRIGAQSNCASNQTSSKSAFLRVASPGDLYSNYGHTSIDLNISKTDFAEDPIDVLQETYDTFLEGDLQTCTQTISTYPYLESFEDGLGLWVQNDLDLSHIGNTDFDWTSNSGGTPTSSTGPSSATDGDFYLYTEATGANVGFPTKRAVLNSPCFEIIADTDAGLSFGYHMFGANVGNLSVRINDGSGWVTVWLIEGNQGDEWNIGNIDLSSYIGETIQIRFDSTTGLGQRSDVAIDNVVLETNILSLDDNVLANDVLMYPNPVQDILNITTDSGLIESIEVYNIHGKKIADHSGTSAGNYAYDTKTLSAGVYFTRIKTTQGESIKRFIKE